MKKAIIIISIIGLAIGWLVWGFHTLDGIETASKNPLIEYDTLFKPDIKNRLQLLANVSSKERLPFSTYVYDKRYNICVYKLALKKSTSLHQAIQITQGVAHKAFRFYAGLPSFGSKMYAGIDVPTNIENIQLKLEADAVSQRWNTTNRLSVHSLFQTFALGYNNQGCDIFAEADEGNQPVNILFLQKGTNLYVFIMTLWEKTIMDKNDLDDIVKN